MRGLCAVAVLAGLGWGSTVSLAATPKVYVAANVPSQTKLAATIKRIAVVEFVAKDSSSQPYAGIAAGRLNSVLAEAPGSPFELVDRTHLKGVLAEQDLGASGVTDSSTAIKAGKMLNVDAIIFGSVHAERSEETVERPHANLPGPLSAISGGGSSTRRSALVNVTFNMIQPETGAVITTRSISRSYDSGKGGGLLKKIMPGGKAPSPEAIVNDLIEQCVAEFGSQIAPHADVFEIALAGSRGTKVGNTFAEGGDFASAATQYQAATQKNPQDDAATFNLGVAKLLLNEPKAASDLFDRAIVLKPDKKYIQIKQQLSQELRETPGIQFRPATTAEIAACKGHLND
jgi:hypothetical protein